MSAAVNHLLRQIRRDGRLAYLIGPGSQSYELLTQEAAAVAGQDVAEYRKNFEHDLQTTPWPREDDILDRIEAAVAQATGSAA